MESKSLPFSELSKEVMDAITKPWSFNKCGEQKSPGSSGCWFWQVLPLLLFSTVAEVPVGTELVKSSVITAVTVLKLRLSTHTNLKAKL
ncbi:hypothetical protein O9993_14055 [Vibrio lentus]|nr:hypothetical protein [Vibrio lentus]